MLENYYQTELFTVAGKSIFLGPLILLFILLVLFIVTHGFLKKKIVPDLVNTYQVSEKRSTRFLKTLDYFLFLIIILAFIYLFELNLNLFERDNSAIKLVYLFEALMIIVIARIADWVITNIFIRRYYLIREQASQLVPRKDPQAIPESSAARIVTIIVTVVAAILLLQHFKLDVEIFQTEINDSPYIFRISNILYAMLAILVAWLIVWAMTQLVMFGFYKRRGVDIGVQFAFNKLIAYVIYVIAAIVALQMLGINMTLIWGGAAALLVGVGLGLQQTFNDLFSGIVLLFERTVKVGDILEVDKVVGTVEKIGLRSSIINSRENITYVVPNSKMTNYNVINWSHIDNYVRFNIDVGVAYGSDTQLVKSILLEAAKQNKSVLKNPVPFIRFNAFGESSLEFSLYFFSRLYIQIEDIKSELRFDIDQQFRNNNVTIPFPQRDVWMRS